MDGCPHCVRFKPEWDKLVEWAKKNGCDCKLIKAGDPEAEDAMIDGYPTLLASKTNGHRDELPTMSAETIIDLLTGTLALKELLKNQSGGGRRKTRKIPRYNAQNDEEQFKVKYLKYKAKYFKLKQQGC